MIGTGDRVAKAAFQVGLREQPSRPDIGSTRELDPSDILEVRELAAAIARAEEVVKAAASSRRDMFDLLGEAPESSGRALLARPTDDISGPAISAPADRPTPIPTATPTAPILYVPSTPSLPALTLRETIDEDAYYHPGGRMRSLADQTLSGFRAESTLMVQTRARRTRLEVVVAALVLPLAIFLCLLALLGVRSAPDARVLEKRAAQTGPSDPKTLETTSVARKAEPAPEQAEPREIVETAGALPVFDVNALPSAR